MPDIKPHSQLIEENQGLVHSLALKILRQAPPSTELQDLVGDDESSVLFRLKERCHALFRPADPDAEMVSPREVLFDRCRQLPQMERLC